MRSELTGLDLQSVVGSRGDSSERLSWGRPLSQSLPPCVPGAKDAQSRSRESPGQCSRPGTWALWDRRLLVFWSVDLDHASRRIPVHETETRYWMLFPEPEPRTLPVL